MARSADPTRLAFCRCQVFEPATVKVNRDLVAIAVRTARIACTFVQVVTARGPFVLHQACTLKAEHFVRARAKVLAWRSSTIVNVDRALIPVKAGPAAIAVVTVDAVDACAAVLARRCIAFVNVNRAIGWPVPRVAIALCFPPEVHACARVGRTRTVLGCADAAIIAPLGQRGWACHGIDDAPGIKGNLLAVHPEVLHAPIKRLLLRSEQRVLDRGVANTPKEDVRRGDAEHNRRTRRHRRNVLGPVQGDRQLGALGAPHNHHRVPRTVGDNKLA